MQHTQAIVPTDDLEAYLNFMSGVQNGPRTNFPKPPIVKLSGDDGTFSIRDWNENTKENEIKPFGLIPHNMFTGVILMAKYYAEWKYKKDAKAKFRTREFSYFRDEPIKLLKIDYESDNKRAQEIATYQDYLAFKDAKLLKDPTTGDITSPFDLWVSLYVLTEDGKIVNFRCRGTSRSEWFDYDKLYKKELGAKTTVQVKTSFTSVMKKKPVSAKKEKDDDKDEYFALSLKPIGLNTREEILKTAVVVRELISWMNAWDKHNTNDDAEQPAPTSDLPIIDATPRADDEIRLEDIPF